MGWTTPRTWVTSEVVSSTLLNAHVRDNLDYLKTDRDTLMNLVLVAPTELTIAGGIISVTQGYHTVDTESDDATDDLVTINGGATGQTVILQAVNDARTIVIKHNTGNIWLVGKADISLDDIRDAIRLTYDGTKWFNCY